MHLLLLHLDLISRSIEFTKAPLVDVVGADPFIGGIGIFFTALKISIFTGFLFALPVVSYQLWAFIAPGLYEHENKTCGPICLNFYYYVLNRYSFVYFVVSLLVSNS